MSSIVFVWVLVSVSNSYTGTVNYSPHLSSEIECVNLQRITAKLDSAKRIGTSCVKLSVLK